MKKSEIEALAEAYAQKNFTNYLPPQDWYLAGLQKGFEMAKERAAAIADEFYSADDCASDIRSMQLVDDAGGEG